MKKQLAKLSSQTQLHFYLMKEEVEFCLEPQIKLNLNLSQFRCMVIPAGQYSKVKAQPTES